MNMNKMAAWGCQPVYVSAPSFRRRIKYISLSYSVHLQTSAMFTAVSLFRNSIMHAEILKLLGAPEFSGGGGGGDEPVFLK
jgi:hypothetical protein